MQVLQATVLKMNNNCLKTGLLIQQFKTINVRLIA